MVKSCPKGQIKRVSYTRRRGRKTSRVPSTCIKATSQTGEKTSVSQRRILSRLKSIHKRARAKFGTPKCGKSEILREGYHKKKYSRKSKSGKRSRVKSTWVEPVCIKSTTGKPHGKQLFRLEKGVLEKFGYFDVRRMPTSKRQHALKRALGELKPLALFRRLNALYVLNKDKDPDIAKVFRSDRDWVRKTPEYQRRQTSRSKK